MNKEQLEFFVTINPFNELFWEIDGFPGYQVSTFGKVKNVITGRILKTRVRKDGYKRVGLCQYGVKKNVLVHRLVCNAFRSNPQNKLCVDHKDHNPKNNHISNLRFATHQENNRNASKRSNNTSKVVGVSWNKRAQKYEAQIQIDGKHKHLGYYDDIETAALARKRAVRKYFGEFANQ